MLARPNIMAERITASAERRRLERRAQPTIAELTLPELRRMMVTTIMFVIILVLFLWMVRTVIIASILGVIVAMYMRPLYLWLERRMPPLAAAGATLAILIVPLLALSAYSYQEIADRAAYVNAHQAEITTEIDRSLRRLPFLETANTSEAVKHYVIVVSNYGTGILSHLREAVASLAISATIFLFTAYYVMVDADAIMRYLRSRIPPRYGELSSALESNVRGVLYGAIYSTFVTQGVKSFIVLAMCIAFQVPLAGVLGILSFIVGFFPIVGSWSVYLPVAAWLAVFRDAMGPALAVLLVGFFVNTVYISTVLRPKIAAERSRVLNFYWMLVALVTGVYTFGLVGILLGPMLIGLLKAILDTIASQPAWQWSDPESHLQTSKGVRKSRSFASLRMTPEGMSTRKSRSFASLRMTARKSRSFASLKMTSKKAGPWLRSG
ncbi:MAG TPA: AI-2E family transporter [Gemmatimonadaceae bacterium]